MNKIKFPVIILILLSIFACNFEGELMSINNSQIIKIPLKFSHVFLIKSSNGYVLVDAAIESAVPDIKKNLKELNITPGEIKLIILTHGHKDHYGGLKAMQDLTGAKILCHEKAAEVIRAGESEPVRAQNFIGKILSLLPDLPAQAVEADITISGNTDLKKWGIDGTVISTPGHSPGSISIILKNGEVLVGDMIRGKPGRISLGMFYVDENQLIKDIQTIISYHPKIMYFSHGGIVTGDDLNGFL